MAACCLLRRLQVVIVAQNLPTSSDGSYECRYTCAGSAAYSTAVIQVDQLSDVGSQTALKCETPLSQQLPPFAPQHG